MDEGLARSTRTGRELGQIIHSCGPNGDNRDVVQEAWSASATMVSGKRSEVKWKSDGPSKLSHFHGQMPMFTKGPAGRGVLGRRANNGQGAGA